MADQRKFLDFLDMIDGGGAGAMGDKFEGGGIFSMLANALATPYGSEDEERKAARMKAHGLLGDAKPTAGAMSISAPDVKPVMRAGNQIVPTYGADAGIEATNRAMDMPYNQPTNIPTMGGEDLLMSMPVSPSAETNRMGAMLNVPSAYDYASMGQQGGNAAPSYANMPYGEMGRMGGVEQSAQPVPQMDVYQQAAKSIADELGNAFYMMPQQEKLMRIQQRVSAMQGM